MWFKNFMLVALAASMASPIETRSELSVCGTDSPTETQRRHTGVLRDMEKVWAKRYPEPELIEVETQFHIITRHARDPVEQAITKQLAVLNKAFASHAFHFSATNNILVWNPPEKMANGKDWLNMGRKHRRGNYTTLNVYILDALIPIDVRGRATLPIGGVRKSDDEYWMDGVTIRKDTLPGGKLHWQDGRVLVHQVGHWLGLFHPHLGSCDEPYPYHDIIDDTPKCNPWHLVRENIMTRENTGKRFTAGQTARMHMSFKEIRIPSGVLD